ncbi:hypothetical protein DENIS_1795 [Desulfonema ishimotonii]|uniref:histidine kinase n=1 Tax=Desulfonema ishimotonii TaxID=45657 RepID=A0A401FV43_9BACT|nr:GAF domain-containing protein [Desulfonema ishimotonii]GBC60836.1 hypothetical protein DENIS_1795 [Desulfonema ishimotonii]
MLKRMKLRHKILFAVGLPVLFISALMTWLLLLHIDNTLRENALELAQEMAYRHGNEVKSRLELPLDTARTLAHTFEGMKKGGKVPDREILNGILKNILINGRDFVSVWSCWEPFVLDGRDDEYINEKGNNRNGRYMPIWHRFSGKMRLDALSDLDYMEYARYCRLARSSGAEIITPPVELSFKDGPAFYSSLIVPVRYNAQIIGVVGITILLNDYSDMVARIRPFGAGYGILVSGTGVIVGHPRKMLIGHPVTEYVREEYRTSLIRSIQSGKPFCFEGASLMHPEKEAYFVFAPFRLGNSDTCWSFAVSVPMDKVLEESRHFARWAVLTGSLALLIMILMIYVLSRHIVKPLYTLVTVSQALAEGNFRRRANLRSRDEFGMAGQYIDSAFDSVVDKMFWYEGMLDAIPFPISVTDPEMRWTFINRAAENILGKTRAAALGRSCTEWNFHICDTDQCGVALLKQGKTNTRFQHSETGTHYQVDVAWLHNARREKIGHIEIIQDISESVRLKQKAEDRNWVRSGEAELNRVMRGEQDVAGIGKNIITFICKYLGAHTGIFYIREPESDMFSLMASYAHVRRKHLASRFREGEGLVGQAALEKVPILLTEIPEDYIRIESGLGAAPPRSIAVLPFLFEDRVRGVIELAAFREFNALEMEFLTLAVRQIGVVINMTEARVRMRLLLKKTQSQAEELQVQQEELRQANGELEAQTQALKISESNLLSQQEELRVTNENLEDRTRDLELQRDDIRKKNRALERARADIAQKVHDLELAGKYKSEFLANMSHELRTP